MFVDSDVKNRFWRDRAGIRKKFVFFFLIHYNGIRSEGIVARYIVTQRFKGRVWGNSMQVMTL